MFFFSLLLVKQKRESFVLRFGMVVVIVVATTMHIYIFSLLFFFISIADGVYRYVILCCCRSLSLSLSLFFDSIDAHNGDCFTLALSYSPSFLFCYNPLYSHILLRCVPYVLFFDEVGKQNSFMNEHP